MDKVPRHIGQHASTALRTRSTYIPKVRRPPWRRAIRDSRGPARPSGPPGPILELATLDQTIPADILLQRMLARAAALLGIVALLLASIGFTE